MRIPLILIPIIASILFLTSGGRASAAEPQPLPPTTIIGITPTGEEVDPPSQIVIQFSNPVVSLGRMDRAAGEISISFTPALPCEWRWLNTSALSCNLAEKDLPKLATRYTITVPKSFDSTRGEVLDGVFTGAFVTKRPSVTGAWVQTWLSPGKPVLTVSTNQKISREEITKHLILHDAQKKSYPFQLDPTKSGRYTDEENAERSLVQEEGRFWALTPNDDLPLDTSMTLKTTRGIVSEEGPEPSTFEAPVFTLDTFPAFTFKGIECYDTALKVVRFPAGPTTGKIEPHTSKCDPLNSIYLRFSSPALTDKISTAITLSPDPTGGNKDVDLWGDTPFYSMLDSSHRRDQDYIVRLPAGLKANTRYEVTGIASAIRDEFGRQLTDDFVANFSTGHRAARYVLDNQFSVLEKDVDSKLPVIVNNIDSLTLSYQAVTTSSNQSGLSQKLTPYKVQDISYAFPVDIRAMLKGRSGVIQGTLSTSPKTSAGPQWFFSQVTPFSVHVKLGHFSSAVWVTSFATGQPVADAKVSFSLNTLKALSIAPKQLTTAQTDTNGVARLPGTKEIDPTLKNTSSWEYAEPLMVATVEKDGEMAIVPLTWEFSVYPNSFYPSPEREYGHIYAWGATAQGVYKAGDTVQFSLWVRDQNDATFVPAPRSTYKLEVYGPTGEIVHTVPEITLSEFGAYSGSFTTSKDAPVGWYNVVLSSNFTTNTWTPLRVLISDFTPATFRVTSDLRGNILHPGDTLTVDSRARLHAGGPYADASTRVTAQVRATSIKTTDTRLTTFTFDTSEENDRNEQIYQKEQRLNAQGDLTSTITVPDIGIAHGDIAIESAVRDDRGKFVATTAKAAYIGRSRYAGIAQSSWVLTAGEETTVQGVVIDEKGSPVAGSPFIISVEREETKGVRVKSAGNVYTTQYRTEKTLIKECALTSTLAPLTCSFTPPQAGVYILTAKVRDEKAREHSGRITRWATGKGPVLWRGETSTHLEILPEKKTYKVGETAKFLIQNPFPGSQALLTTERFGIQRSWTQTLPDSTAVIEVPITSDHIPGMYFSATVLSPRVEKPIEGTVDLGKPAFRMGYAGIEVVDSTKQLSIQVTTSAEEFRPRETVTVNVSGAAHDLTIPPMEYAVTVLDEGVFDLIASGNAYFDPYKGFYFLAPLDVKNFNIMRTLVGLQKFEKKGANAGGDGGSAFDMRSIKKFVSYWNPSIRADAQGRATFSFEAPDNLTGWKVLVMAVTKDDKMGLGVDTFKVNKTIEIHPALPNQVRQGDEFTASFTVMNRSDSARNISIEAIAGGAASGQPTKVTIDAEPYKRYPVSMQAKAESAGTATFTVSASHGSDRDDIRESLTVLPRASLQTSATFGISTGDVIKEEIVIPPDIAPNLGSIGATVTSSLIGNLDGAFEYMRDYPYMCWEQKLSKGVMAAHALSLKHYLPESFVWQDAEELVRKTLDDMSAHQAPNGGMTFYQASDEYANQYLSAYTALALTWLRDRGYSIPEDRENKLHEYLLGVLKNDEFPALFTGGMRSNVRAVALAALARRGKITEQDLLRFSSAVKDMNVFGKAHYLAAALEFPNAKSARKNTLDQILSSGQQSGATMKFSEPVDTLFEWLLDSDMRTQCAVLDTLVQASQAGEKTLAAPLVPLLPKIVRSITLERKRAERWENTQENLFCMNALARYARHFEKSTPNLEIGVTVGSQELAKVELKGFKSEPVEVSRPLTPQDAGRTTDLTLTPQGKGPFYYSARLRYALKDLKRTPTNAGVELTREYSVQRNGAWVLLKSPITIRQGELVRVDLLLRTSTPRNFIVVDDPVPGGLEPVNRDLATASSLDESAGALAHPPESAWHSNQGWNGFRSSFWGFYHKELRHSAARFYSEYLPAGNYYLSYVSQAIAPGEFSIAPAHSEEMYDPDVFGESGADTLIVAPTP